MRRRWLLGGLLLAVFLCGLPGCKDHKDDEPVKVPGKVPEQRFRYKK